MKIRVQVVSLLAVACFAVCVGCFTSASAQESQEIPVMTILAMTGPVGFAGMAENNGIRLAIDEANQSGYLGEAKVKLIEGDYASEKAQAISLAKQAIKLHRVVLSLGPTLTTDGIALGQIFNENKTPMISFATSYQITATGPWVFKIQMAPQETVPPLAKYILEKTQVRKMAILYNDANEAMIENAKLFGTLFKAGGGTVIAEEACNEKETNFLPLVTKLASMNLDGIYFSIYAEQSANIMIQLRQGGLPANVRFFGEQGLASPRLVEIGGKAAEGTVVPGQFMAGVDRPLNKHFEHAYMARYKTKPAFFEAIGYSCGLVALKAIKDTMPNPTRENVRNALANIRDVPVVVGNGFWNHKDRNGNYGVVVTVVKGGKFVVAP